MADQLVEIVNLLLPDVLLRSVEIVQHRDFTIAYLPVPNTNMK